MQFQYIYTRLNVENFPACKTFYRDVMGLNIKFEDEMDEYVEFETGSIRITLFNRSKLTDFIPKVESLSYDAHTAQVILSFQVSSLDDAISHLNSKKVALY